MAEDFEETSIRQEDNASYIPERNYYEYGYQEVGSVQGLKPLGSLNSNICESCVFYYKNLHKLGLKKTPNTPTCQGHVTEVYKDVKPEDFDDPHDYEILKQNADPVSWAYAEFGFSSYFYQQESLSCSSYKKVLRQGRRCVVTDTPVLMSDGTWKSIQDVLSGDYIVSYDHTDNNIKQGTVTHLFNNGEQEVYKIRLTNGRSIICTSNHPLLKLDLTWYTINDGLCVNDSVAVLDEYDSVRYIAIELIEYVGIRQTWDICVDKYHSFVADGIITHNSGKTTTAVIDILHKAIHNENFKVLIVSPFSSQIDIIFQMIDLYIGNSLNIRDSVTRNVRNPQRRELSNGSFMVGFPIKPGDPTTVDKLRGIEADYIYLDECVPAGTLVSVSKFAVRPVETLTIDTPIFGATNEGVCNGGISALSSRYAENIITLPTPINVLKCTMNHPVFDGENDVEAQYAKYAIVSLYHNDNLNFGRKSIIARLCGYNFGDGWIQKDSRIVGFSGQKEDLEQIVEDLVLLGCKRHKIYERFTENKAKGIAGVCAQFSDTNIFPILSEFCPRGIKTDQLLKVPDFVKNGTDYVKSNFLSGLFSAEATGIKFNSTNRRTPRTIDIRMRSSKEEWIKAWLEEIKQLFTDLGIRTNDVQVIPLEGKYRGELRVCNSKENIDKYIKIIGFCYNAQKTKGANTWRLYRWYESMYNSDNWKRNREILKYSGSPTSVGKILNLARHTITYNRKKANPIFSYYKLCPEELVNYFTWKPGYVRLPIIKSGRKIMPGTKVYNMTSTAGSRFFANGVLTHNCDHIDPEHIEIIMPILLRKNVYLMATSTPKGTKTHWYNWATNKDLGFKELWFIAAENPRWDSEENAQFIGNTTTQSVYSREYDAEFTVSEAGVFRKDLIDAAMQHYTLSSCHPDHTKASIMGVDWNKGEGAHIVIVAWDGDKFKLVNKIVINPDEFKQTTAVGKIIDLNATWKPGWIFVDEGYGSVNIEMLQKHGMVYPDTGLHRKVIAVNMSSHLEINNPANNTRHKKYAKTFMVNNTAKYLEDGLLVLPSSEDTSYQADKTSKQDGSKIGIIQQMRNFEIKRISALGRPIYSQGYEHTLTAYMLAILGFTMKHTKYGDPDTVSVIHDLTNKIGDTFRSNKAAKFFDVSRGFDDINDSSIPRLSKDPEIKGSSHYIPVNVPKNTRESINKEWRRAELGTNKNKFKKGTFRKHF